MNWTESEETPDGHLIGTTQGLRVVGRAVHDLKILLVHANAELAKYDSEKFSVPVVLFNAVRESTEAFGVLLDHEHFRDAFPTARSIFETALNAIYILCPGSLAEERAIKHAKQKGHRQITATYEFRNSGSRIGWPPGLSFKPPPEFEQALSEYTSKKGREITSWTPESIGERIDLIEQWLGGGVGDSLRFQYDSIYPSASEIAHGTLFSVVFWLGAWNFEGDPQSPEFVHRHRVSETTVCAVQVTSTLHNAILAICRTTGKHQFREKAKARLSEMARALGLAKKEN